MFDIYTTIFYHFIFAFLCSCSVLFSLCMWAQMHTVVRGQPQKLAFTFHLVLKQCLFVALLLCTSGLSVPKILGILQFPTPIPSWGHWNYRHSLLRSAFTCVLVSELRSSCLCTRRLTYWAICPALICCFIRLFLPFLVMDSWNAVYKLSCTSCLWPCLYFRGFFLVHHRWVTGILIYP